MSVMQYEMRFSKLARHVVWLVPTDRKRIRRFIDGLTYQLQLLMTRDRVSGSTFEEVVDIARQIEAVRSKESVEREAKRPRGSGGSGGVPSGGQSYHNRGRPYRHTQEGRPVHRGASSGHSSYGSSGSYSGSQDPPQNLPAFSNKSCFECGDLGHIKRYCPHLTRGPVQQRSHVTTSVPAASTPTLPAWDEAQSARGRPRGGGRLGGGHARFYTFPARPDVVASDTVITFVVVLDELAIRFSSLRHFPFLGV
ncbi:uncharacterized protein [Nicotiana tomentosiformis]|uniref:uncharacterized protein n=1 Tax=Nicotiana tomentosiformis TaxID=4098 RepID=UPI00388C7F49